MRFLVAVIDSASNSASGDEIAAIDKFNDGLEKNGNWVFACGIADPSTAVVLDNRAGAGVVSAGPLYTNDEYMSGFWVIQAPDLATAHELALAGSLACNRKVEVRPLLG